MYFRVPLGFRVPLIQLNTRKQGTLVLNGTLGNLVTQSLPSPMQQYSGISLRVASITYRLHGD